MNNINESYKKIIAYYDSVRQDVYIYVGPIDSKIQLLRDIIRSHSNKKEEVCLFLATYGGDPDWAYRLVTTLRKHYIKFHIVIPGYCKSAGTLIALGADTLKFHEYGELGPLDVQMKRKDNLLGYNSGLDVFQAISVINTSAHECFHKMFIEFLLKGGGFNSYRNSCNYCKRFICWDLCFLGFSNRPFRIRRKESSYENSFFIWRKIRFSFSKSQYETRFID